MKKKIFISAYEPSADLHCGNLIQAINDKVSKNNDLEIEFTGLGGPKMQAAGCDLLENTVDKAAMIYNAFTQIWAYFKRLRRISAYLKSTNVDLVIVCDSPAFNFHIAKAAKKAGIKVLFYVAPQLWAWAPWRIRKLRKCCDKLACILPFEQEWFAGRGVDVTFVGNPLLDEVNYDEQKSYRDYTNFDPANSTVALMPGSRGAEIKTLWQPMQQIAKKLQTKYPNIKFITPAVNEEKLQTLKQTQLPDLDIEYVLDGLINAASRADLSLVASGSATLQVAATGCPMVIMYQSSRIMWHLLGRWLINIRLLSLVNILAAKELCPEFMPYFTSIEPIFEKTLDLLDNVDLLADANAGLAEIVKPLLLRGKVSYMVADISLGMLE
ncbi:MAG: lipid-A-disaccharide synthase [Planctomycetes bacterium]|nr:lipid-A-disaccharide synthase [Planctomycetota bacterium]